MNRGNRPWHPTAAAAIEWEDNGTPRATAFADVYYSRDNGMAESRQVFLTANRLPQRWREHSRHTFCIGETGFGTGLNFLLTWQAWRSSPEPRPNLHFLAIERYPLCQKDLARALAAWPELAPLADALLKNYPGLLPGQHRLLLDNGRVRLDLWWEDIGEAMAELAMTARARVDAWYLDGFAPARNPDMWQPDLFAAMARASREGATFGTFTAAGQVRRDLAAAGFRVERVAGYGRKRECLAGALQSSPREEAHGWDIETGGQSVPERVLVLGAGLAGSFAAHALARRGVEVTVLDTAGVASGGSGNEQGVLYTRLSRRHSPLVDFALQSYCHALNSYRGMFASNILETGHDGELCGCFHQQADEEELRALQPLLGDVADFAQVLDAVTANGLLGIEQAAGGFWHPGSGWLHPPAVCRALLDAPGVDLREHCGPLTLVREDGRWQARTKREVIAQAPCAIVATGVATAAMPGLEWLPLQAIRGQTTLLPATDALSRLRAALCHEGYVTPARTGTHCVGATFDPGDMEPSLRKADHRLNLERLGRAVPGWQDELAALDPQCIEGRVGWRCASPDYLPMVGPVPDREAFLEDFAALRRNAKTAITGRGRYLPGLYLNTAHGSRGLTSTPLAAELLASLVCCEPPPVCRELSRALAPARFIIRDLSRNRI